jgi:putative sterol carrier protein
MSEVTIEKMMNRMPKDFLPEKAVGVEAVVQYHLSGDEPGDWIITIRDGECKVDPGIAENPKMTLSAASQDYKDVILGKINAMNAFMDGKLQLAGDLNLAMKLMTFFKLN